MVYRANFFALLFVDMINIAIPVLFFKVVFAENKFIAGWSFESVLILVGLVGIMHELAYLTFRGGFSMLGYMIRTGRLDLILTKPFNTQLLVAFQDISINESTGEGIIGIGLIIFGIINLDALPTIPGILLFLFFIACSYILYYSFTMIVNSIAFWVIKSDGFNALVWSFMELARYPRSILRGAGKIIFTFIIPASIVAVVPASALTGSIDLETAGIFLAVTVIFFIISNFVWWRGIRRYESASS